MNEWIYDDLLDAVRERLNVPSEHWEDYGPGSSWANHAVIRQPGPSEDDAIIRAAEPWDTNPLLRGQTPPRMSRLFVRPSHGTPSLLCGGQSLGRLATFCVKQSRETIQEQVLLAPLRDSWTWSPCYSGQKGTT
jgi:hypothetical protein